MPIAPKMHNTCSLGPHRSDIITPGTSTVATFEIEFEICEISGTSQTQRQVNAFIMSWTSFPPKTRFVGFFLSASPLCTAQAVRCMPCQNASDGGRDNGRCKSEGKII